MSGWDAYVQTQLIASGAISQGAILGKADLQLYAQEGGFELKSGYAAPVTNEDGTEGSAQIDEVATLVSFFSTGTKPKYGFRMNGVKYQLLRESEGPTLTLKCSGGGATVAATNTLIIVGIYKQDTTNMNAPVQCTAAVEALADYLRQSQY